MKEEKIKSALEIAMEKVSDLPELTREEIEEQKEKEYGPVGDAVAKKYLSGTISDGELPPLMSLLNGHPYLTRMALYTIAADRLSWGEFEAVASSDRLAWHCGYLRSNDSGTVIEVAGLDIRD